MCYRKLVTVFIIVLYFLNLSPKCVLSQEHDYHDKEHITMGNILSNIVEVAKGIFGNIGNALPTLTEIFEAPKQLIAGYPVNLVYGVLNELCSFSLKAGSIKSKYKPTYDNVAMQFHANCEVFHYNLNDVDQLVSNPHFELDKKVIIMTTGWIINANNSKVVSQMSKAFNCRGDVNFLVYNTVDTINSIYIWSAFNTKELGSLYASFLQRLVDSVPIENIHLIGHSLGAHITAFAGRAFHEQTSMQIPHITGLDPAKACFNEGEGLSGISRGDAQFIDVIHSNPASRGILEALGDVDFYANGFEPLVPGCHESLCSHERSVWYYIETIYPGNEQNFMATRCSSLHKLRHGRCEDEQQHAMGYAVDKSLVGSYFMEVKSSSPFGQGGSKEREETNKNCGLCEKN